MKIKRLIALSSLLLVSSACQPPSSQLESNEQMVIGGSPNPFDEAVVAVFAGGLCTGTLVAPEVVLTAAHCVGDAIEAGQTNFGSVNFGDGRGPWIDSIPIRDMVMHRLYNPPAFLKYDIALVRLSRPAPESITPLPISRRALSEEDVGLQVRVVGFGNNYGGDPSDPMDNASGAGVKRQATLSLREVTPSKIGYGDSQYNTCQGDSGGPTFATFSGQEVVVGVTSYGASGCGGLSFMTRTDIMWDPLLTEVIEAWSGACKHDGQCVTEGCGFPDPDCDVCGMDNVCGSECERVDRDCPLGTLPSKTCESDFDCESRICLESPEDPRVKYCSLSCDPSLASSDNGCRVPIGNCVDQGTGEGLCRFFGTTPRAQGAECSEGQDCRSSMCDSKEEICVETCGEGLPECSEEFECQKLGDFNVCSVPAEATTCGCQSTPSPTQTTLWLGVLLVLGWSRRRLSVTSK